MVEGAAPSAAFQLIARTALESSSGQTPGDPGTVIRCKHFIPMPRLWA